MGQLRVSGEQDLVGILSAVATGEYLRSPGEGLSGRSEIGEKRRCIHHAALSYQWAGRSVRGDWSRRPSRLEICIETGVCDRKLRTSETGFLFKKPGPAAPRY